MEDEKERAGELITREETTTNSPNRIAKLINGLAGLSIGFFLMSLYLRYCGG